MKFQDRSEFELLRKSLIIRESLYIPALYESAKALEPYFDHDDLYFIQELTEELATAHRNGGTMPEKTKLAVESLSKESKKLGIQDKVLRHIQLLSEKNEYSRISAMKPQEQLDALVQIRKEPEKAISDDIADFANLVLGKSSHSVAQDLSDRIGDYMQQVKSGKAPKTSAIEKLVNLQNELKRDYPIKLRRPSKNPTKEPNSLLSKIKQGTETVTLAIASVAGKPIVKKSIAVLLAAGMLYTVGANTVSLAMDAHEINSSSYSTAKEAGITDNQLFSSSTTTTILDIRDKLNTYDQKIPTDEEFLELVDQVDNFYDGVLKEKTTEAYNEYALDNNLPLAKSVEVKYVDTNNGDGPQNKLIVTDTAGKTHYIDTDSNNLFQKYNIDSIYSSERGIDSLRSNYRSAMNNEANDEYDLAKKKQSLLKDIRKDFESALDLYTLDFNFERQGFIHRIMGEDYIITFDNQIPELSGQNRTDITQNTTTQDDIRDER